MLSNSEYHINRKTQLVAENSCRPCAYIILLKPGLCIAGIIGPGQMGNVGPINFKSEQNVCATAVWVPDVWA